MLGSANGLGPFCFMRVFSRDLSRLVLSSLSSFTSFSFICRSLRILRLRAQGPPLLFLVDRLIPRLYQSNQGILVGLLLGHLAILCSCVHRPGRCPPRDRVPSPSSRGVLWPLADPVSATSFFPTQICQKSRELPLPPLATSSHRPLAPLSPRGISRLGLLRPEQSDVWAEGLGLGLWPEFPELWQGCSRVCAVLRALRGSARQLRFSMSSSWNLKSSFSMSSSTSSPNGNPIQSIYGAYLQAVQLVA